MRVFLKYRVAEKLDKLIEDVGKDNIDYVELTFDEMRSLHREIKTPTDHLIEFNTWAHAFREISYRGIRIKIVDDNEE